jgi:hypothetical protein
MAKRKFVKSDIVSVLKSFSNRTYEQALSHSFAAGYLESMLASAIVDMPRHKQLECLKSLQNANYK